MAKLVKTKYWLVDFGIPVMMEEKEMRHPYTGKRMTKKQIAQFEREGTIRKLRKILKE